MIRLLTLLAVVLFCSCGKTILEPYNEFKIKNEVELHIYTKYSIVDVKINNEWQTVGDLDKQFLTVLKLDSLDTFLLYRTYGEYSALTIIKDGYKYNVGNVVKYFY